MIPAYAENDGIDAKPVSGFRSRAIVANVNRNYWWFCNSFSILAQDRTSQIEMEKRIMKLLPKQD